MILFTLRKCRQTCWDIKSKLSQSKCQQNFSFPHNNLTNDGITESSERRQSRSIFALQHIKKNLPKTSGEQSKSLRRFLNCSSGKSEKKTLHGVRTVHASTCLYFLISLQCPKLTYPTCLYFQRNIPKRSFCYL